MVTADRRAGVSHALGRARGLPSYCHRGLTRRSGERAGAGGGYSVIHPKAKDRLQIRWGMLC